MYLVLKCSRQTDLQDQKESEWHTEQENVIPL